MPVHIVRPILSDNGVQLEFVAEESAEFYVEQRYFIASYHDKPDHYYSYQMVGSAMSPTINPGETVLMRPWRDRPFIHDGVYLLTGIHGLAVRRLGFSGDHVTVKGDNPDIEPSSYSLDQFGQTFTIHMICRSVRKML
ncbi:MAG TPA: S24/S26 family peptidase [Rhodothermales bacterium]|nr:S24/S26 family peptidase [Rhodothermales bacterium]